MCKWGGEGSAAKHTSALGGTCTRYATDTGRVDCLFEKGIFFLPFTTPIPSLLSPCSVNSGLHRKKKKQSKEEREEQEEEEEEEKEYEEEELEEEEERD